MKYVADILERYTRLEALSNDPKIINEDGSLIDPYLELAAEIYEIPLKQVTFEGRNAAMRIHRAALQNDILSQGFTFNGYTTSWNNSR